MCKKAIKWQQKQPFGVKRREIVRTLVRYGKRRGEFTFWRCRLRRSAECVD